jgi:hypothetical protein
MDPEQVHAVEGIVEEAVADIPQGADIGGHVEVAQIPGFEVLPKPQDG